MIKLHKKPKYVTRTEYRNAETGELLQVTERKIFATYKGFPVESTEGLIIENERLQAKLTELKTILKEKEK